MLFDRAFRTSLAASLAAFERAPADTAHDGLKRAAVAVALAPADDPAYAAFLLTRRAARLRAHGGQWALPGGRCDAGETPIETALREMDEEIGLRLSAADALGVLDDYPTRSGYLITPVVFWRPDGAPEPVANPDEVETIYRIPISDIARDDAVEFETIPESPRQVVRLKVLEGHNIHAPTAAMLYQFRELCAGRVTRVAELEQPVFAWR
jgi:8-oxo-dGTP pyrophosphatase MutT (NUDIX family)